MEKSSTLNPPLFDGSRLFLWVSLATGVPIDVVNFIISQLFALLFATIYRKAFHPSRCTPAQRHCAALLGGVTLLYFCFGRNIYFLVFLTGVCYFITSTFQMTVMPRSVLLFSFLFLSCFHFMRLYGAHVSTYSLDVLGPIMVAAQKVTSIAFALKDGSSVDRGKLTSLQKLEAIDKLPSILEYFSYVLNFQTCSVGPMLSYKTYIDFIEGRNYARYMKPVECSGKGRDTPSPIPANDPSPTKAVFWKLTQCAIASTVFFAICPIFPVSRLNEEDFLVNTPFIGRLLYIMLSTTLIRSKYYSAWLVADAICNASGLGFNGWNEDGTSRWDLVSNIDIMKVEFSTSARDTIGYWNISTTKWLRYVAFERAPFYPTLAAYFLSAIWHGFYPGYYLTFLFGAMLTVVGRTMRRCVRPFFQGTRSLRLFYDVLTFTGVRIACGYATFPFMLQSFWPCFRVYSSLYWSVHIVTTLLLVFTPLVFPTKIQVNGDTRSKTT